MQFTSYLAIFSSLLAPLITAAPAEVNTRACSCTHNNDAGRWKDVHDPRGALDTINLDIDGKRKCYSAVTQGIMCLEGDVTQQSCMKDAVKQLQSYHGDWFIWTRVDCGALRMTIQAN